MSGKLDMTAMYVMHDALRRELQHLAKTTAGLGDDPRRIMTTAAGWELFKKALHAHHTAEDEALWPPVRQAVAGLPGDLALLDAMEFEHAAIDPLIEGIDAALADPESEPDLLAGLADALAAGLIGHLDHEEREVLPLIAVSITEAQLQDFGQAHGRLIGPDASRILPWMLDGASPKGIATMLDPLPAPVRTTYQDEWLPAYTALARWT